MTLSVNSKFAATKARNETDTSDPNVDAFYTGAPLPGFQAPTAQYAFLSSVSATTASTLPSTSVSTPAPSVLTPTGTSAAVPSWVSTLSTASIAADMAAADVGGTVTYGGLEKLVADLDATLTSTNTSLTTAELADLKTIAKNLNNGMTTSTYLTDVMNNLANGNPANATWTGGAAASTSLGNLAAGSSATQLAELNGKWLLGTDLPSSQVAMSGYSSFSVTYSASSNPLFGASGPSMNDVNQGYLGDCYFLSSVAEVAEQNSGIISSMFTSNGNNAYGVRFYVDGTADYVTVNTSLADGGGIFNHGTDIWASLAEKGYAQLQAGGVDTGNYINDGNSWSTIGNGGAPAYALEAVTGASAITDFYTSGGSCAAVVFNSSLAETSYSSGISTAGLLGTLVSDLANGDDLVLSSYTNATDSSGRTTLVADHAMSIYGYDSTTGMLDIRNPWGTASGQSWDTTFEVSLSTVLSDGDVITADNIGTGTGLAAPVVSAQTATQTWKLGQAVNFALASNTFTDPQGQTLTYTATQVNGAALPSWLSFNAATKTFTGTPPAGSANLSIKVTATDAGGASTSETFAANLVAPAAPTITSQTAAQSWKLGAPVNFALAANTFTDPSGEALTYTATQVNGSALPSWLSFNAATKTFTGTPPAGSANLSIKVTATDAGGASTSETFAANLVAPAAPTITSQTANQTWTIGKPVNLALAANTFTDPSGEALTYTATQSNGSALPSWLSFNAATKTFTGTPPNTAAGLTLKVTATDAGGSSASETFTVATPATPPSVTAQAAAQSWKLGQAVNFTLASNAFTDPQGETLTYSATQANGSALPSWLSFNAATRTFTGTVPTNAAGLSIKVTATDTSGAANSETFSVATPAPAAPSVTAQTAGQVWTEGQSINLALPSNTFTDPQGEKLTYTATQANGSALPSWLTFNGATDSFTGVAPNATASLSLKVTATDAGGASVSETFAASVAAAAGKLVTAISSVVTTSTSVTTGLVGSANNNPVTLASPAH